MPILALFALLAQTAERDYTAVRERMMREHIEERGVRNPQVLRAMREVPRHLFVPAGLRGYAYQDNPLPIGNGQTISQPYIVALMTEMLAVERTHTVLEIGSGSGYQAAVLSLLAEHVYSIEIVPELARMAAENLSAVGYHNVTVRQGDGYQGWPEHAPFDRIILTAAPAQIPQKLIDQLKPGGRLVAPIGDWDQILVTLDKDSAGHVTRRAGIGVRFVPMVTAPHPGK